MFMCFMNFLMFFQQTNMYFNICFWLPLSDLHYSYMSLCVFLIVSLGLATALLALSYLFATQKPYSEKSLGYECGFNPYDDASIKFDMHFYLVAILFMLFDLEMLFLFPWVICLKYFWMRDTIGFWTGMLFIFILTLGFIYEWKKGALDWW